MSGQVWYHQVIHQYTTLGKLNALPREVRDLIYEQILTNVDFLDRRLDVEDCRILASTRHGWIPGFPCTLRSSSTISSEAALVAQRLNILVVRTGPIWQIRL
jgi:hypothetical protein